jgi:CRISPR-associated endonuclease/helicase Cas3
MDEVFKRVLNGNPPYPHQLRTAENLIKGKSVVLRAPCGSGKTEACYVSLLLDRGDNLPDRLIYSLPTRALVDDVSDRIKKGVSQVGLPPIVSPQHGANSEDPFFKGEIVVATIDQTIGAYCCTPLSLPVHLGNIPAGAAVSSFLCFDEAHVYDHLLGLQSMLILVERAAELGVPFLIMSATLPDSFIKWFKSNNKFSDKIGVVEGKDEDVPKRRDRHVTLKWKGKLLECKDVLNCAGSCQRIIVACNTVDRAQELFGLVKEPLVSQGFEVFLLHSRFLDKDREDIEKLMKDRLKDPDKKTCLITTQVCEVGLDISCDLLLTELAPPDSLIQRMGRCAREGREGEVWVFDVEYYAPYSNEDMERSKKYVSEILDGKRVGWNEELEFVNNLLGEEFEDIVNDESLRRKILLSLGDAAFKGNKREIENNVREVFSTNLTVYDDPYSLHEKILHMPWISVDTRILRKFLGKANIWQVTFGHDEYGSPDFHINRAFELYPYEYYVIHPDYAKYSRDSGLILGSKGENLEPLPPVAKHRPEFEYHKETWEEHANNCLSAFEKLKKSEQYGIRLLAKLIDYDYHKTEGLVALSVAIHDLGKLNEEWQKSIGVKANGTPLAHIPLREKIGVPHATISADASYPLFRKLIDSPYYAIAFKLAIAHHHHTRAEHVEPYILKWEDVYGQIMENVCEKYSLDASPYDIRQGEDFPKHMETSMFDIESADHYTAYCVVARFVRLSDQASFHVEEGKT